MAWLWVAAGGATLVAHPASAAPTDHCAPAEGLHFICGTGAAEDIVQVPGTRWLITSNLHLGAPAPLHLIDTLSKSARPLAVTFASPVGTDCPGAPDPAAWSMDGLSIARTGGRTRLFAANHGDRRAIEMFDVHAGRDGVKLRWTGCAPLPAGTLGNGIAARTTGDIFVTSFHAPDDPEAWAKMARREPTGSVWHLHEGKGFERVETGPISGANGIALSPDGRQLYISAWSESALVVLDRVTGKSRRIALDFLPDNIHVQSNGLLLIGGQRTSVASIGACGAQCPQPWFVARIDPKSGRSVPVAQGPGSVLINYACGALEARGNLYITVRGDNRIAWRPAR